MQVCISFAEFVHTPFRKRKKIYLIRKAGYLGNYAAGWLAVYRYGKQISPSSIHKCAAFGELVLLERERRVKL